jgi:hypothetical protein
VEEELEINTTPIETSQKSEGSEKWSGVIGDASLIRTETALSRFPVHRITKKGTIQIELKDPNAEMVWRVSHNSDYGQPGPLAYKIDTLVISQKIDEVTRPIPTLLRLGSLKDICEQIGITHGQGAMDVKKALLQNASTFIRAKIEYRTSDGGKRSLEAGFTRYSVLFTGESLPDGRTADGVHLVLNEIYRDVLNSAVYRPLNYEYMKSLTPAGQRFYEIVSYQIFAALRQATPGVTPRAQLRYSEYCMLSTQVRYFDFDHVKKQMYKIHKPHVDSGYLAKVQYESTVDGGGEPDWFIHYHPGFKAEEDYQQAMGRKKKSKQEPSQSKQDSSPNLPTKPSQTPKPTESLQSILELDYPSSDVPEPLPDAPESLTNATEGLAETIKVEEEGASAVKILIEKLVEQGVNRVDAKRLAKENPEECLRQLDYLPFVTEFRTSRGAYLRSAIEKGFGAPVAFEQQQQESEKQRLKQEQEQTRRVTLEARRASSDASIDTELIRLENEAPEAFQAFLVYVEEQRRVVRVRFSGLSDSARQRMLHALDTPERRRTLYHEWQQSNTQNPVKS